MFCCSPPCSSTSLFLTEAILRLYAPKEGTCRQTYRILSASSLLRHQLLHPLLPDAFQLRIILCQVLLSIVFVMQLRFPIQIYDLTSLP